MFRRGGNEPLRPQPSRFKLQELVYLYKWSKSVTSVKSFHESSWYTWSLRGAKFSTTCYDILTLLNRLQKFLDIIILQPLDHRTVTLNSSLLARSIIAPLATSTPSFFYFMIKSCSDLQPSSISGPSTGMRRSRPSANWGWLTGLSLVTQEPGNKFWWSIEPVEE